MEKLTISVFTILFLNTNLAYAKLTGDFKNSSSAKAFINSMAKTSKYTKSDLEKIISNADFNKDVLDKYLKPKKNIAEYKKTFEWYRDIFITDENIKNGKAFMKKYKPQLIKAEKKYGVPKEYIGAIIGVETKYGKYLGDYSVLGSLATLAFKYKKRSKYFTSELKNFLLMAKEQRFKPNNPKGSYAGAMGYGQFMPSSYRSYAVDFDGNGKADLWNKVDAIGSIANYFKRKGWKRGQNAMTGKDGNGKRLYNFKIIKRYNNSNRYARVVHMLAQKIK